jgi:hypothetical protein
MVHCGGAKSAHAPLTIGAGAHRMRRENAYARNECERQFADKTERTMSYRKTLNLKPVAEMQLRAAAKRYGVSDTNAVEIALRLLDQVDHVRKESKVVGVAVQSPSTQPQQQQQELFKEMYFNG